MDRYIAPRDMQSFPHHHRLQPQSQTKPCLKQEMLKAFHYHLDSNQNLSGPLFKFNMPQEETIKLFWCVTQMTEVINVIILKAILKCIAF